MIHNVNSILNKMFYDQYYDNEEEDDYTLALLIPLVIFFYLELK